MEYSAAAVKHLLWFVETRETAKLLQNHTMDEVKEIIIKNNLYQQKAQDRIKNEFGVIKRRLEALPEELVSELVKADIKTAKLIVFIGCMAADRLLFELVYEVYRDKLYMGATNITAADLNIFFKNKQDQSEKVASMTEATVNKLKQTYSKYMFEAGLLSGKVTEKVIVKPYIEPKLKGMLQLNGMDKYLAAVAGER